MPGFADLCGSSLQSEVRSRTGVPNRPEGRSLGDHLVALQADPDHVVGRRPEAVRVGDVSEPPEQRSGVPVLLLTARRPTTASTSSTAAARVVESEARGGREPLTARSLTTWIRRPARPSSVINTATGARTRRNAYQGAFGMAKESSKPHPAPGRMSCQLRTSAPAQIDWAQRHSARTVAMRWDTTALP